MGLVCSWLSLSLFSPPPRRATTISLEEEEEDDEGIQRETMVCIKKTAEVFVFDSERDDS